MNDGPVFFFGIVFGLFITVFVPRPATTLGEIEWAQQQCATNEGLKSVKASSFLLHTRAVCNNTAIFKKKPAYS